MLGAECLTLTPNTYMSIQTYEHTKALTCIQIPLQHVLGRSAYVDSDPAMNPGRKLDVGIGEHNRVRPANQEHADVPVMPSSNVNRSRLQSHDTPKRRSYF